MGTLALYSHFSTSLSSLIKYSTSQTFHKHVPLSFRTPFDTHTQSSISSLLKTPNYGSRLCPSNPKATLDQELLQEEPGAEVDVEGSLKVLKNAAKTRKVKAEEVLAALSLIKKAKLDTSDFLQTLGGNESPGKTWMLIFTTKDGMKGGSYFPITAVQRFDAAAMRIENGVYFALSGA